LPSAVRSAGKSAGKPIVNLRPSSPSEPPPTRWRRPKLGTRATTTPSSLASIPSARFISRSANWAARGSSPPLTSSAYIRQPILVSLYWALGGDGLVGATSQGPVVQGYGAGDQDIRSATSRCGNARYKTFLRCFARSLRSCRDDDAGWGNRL
jgi:hypothetical protein